MKQPAYLPLKGLRFWRASAGDVGVHAIVRVCLWLFSLSPLTVQLLCSASNPSPSPPLRAPHRPRCWVNGHEGIAVTLLELIDCEVGPLGCGALGRALTLGGDVSLTTLKYGPQPPHSGTHALTWAGNPRMSSFLLLPSPWYFQAGHQPGTGRRGRGGAVKGPAAQPDAQEACAQLLQPGPRGGEGGRG
jgi:hypothetical protein